MKTRPYTFNTGSTINGTKQVGYIATVSGSTYGTSTTPWIMGPDEDTGYVICTTNPTIVQKGLVLNLDAGNINSYPTTGTTWTDLSGNANHGQLVNGTTYNSDNFGSLVFDGVDDYVNLNDVLDLGFNSMTISMWLYNTELPTISKYVLSKSLAASQNWRYAVRVRNIDGSLRVGAFMQGDGGADVGVDSVDNLNLYTWYNVVWCYDRQSKISIYLNTNICELLNSPIISQWKNGNFQSNNPFRIASYVASDNITPTSFFNGKIGDICVYHRLLSESEILQNFNAVKWRYNL